MALTAHQERFAQNIAFGMDEAEAYRAAYKVGSMGARAVAAEAARLVAQGHVAQRVAALKGALAANGHATDISVNPVAPVVPAAFPTTDSVDATATATASAADALWTRLDSVRALAEIATHAESKPGERMAAIKELNAMYGFGAPVRLDSGAGFELHVHFDEVSPAAGEGVAHPLSGAEAEGGGHG